MSNEGWFLNTDVIRSSKLLLDRNFPLIIKPICYIRRIDHWVESAWKQWGLKQYDSFDEFVNRPEHYRLFERAFSHLEMWNEIIDKKNIIIRPYEKQQLAQGLLHDFFAVVGIDYNAYEWIELTGNLLAANSGFNRDVVEMLHLCRKLFSHLHDNHLFHIFTELLGDEFQKNHLKPTICYPLKPVGN